MAAVAVFTAAIAAALPTFPNVGYIGKGYDPLKGNPHAVGMTDPGFRDNVFQFIYRSNKSTSDHRYVMPDGIEVDICQACQVSWSSETIYGSSSYQKSLEEDVKVEGSGWGAKFSASVDYKKVDEGTAEHNSIFTSAKATCYVYCARIATYDLPKFTHNFINGVASLPETYHESSYIRFIETFGTHTTWSIKMGGVFGQQSKFTSGNWTKMQSQGIKVDVAAGFSAMGVSASVSSMTDDQKKQASTFQHYSSKQEVWTLGGHPPADGKIETWISTAVKEPMPITYTVDRLENLFTSTNFPNDSNIHLKKAALQKATSAYCEHLYHLKEVKMCSSPYPDDVEFCHPGKVVMGINSNGSPICGVPRTCRWCRNGCGGHYTASVGQRLHEGHWGDFTAYDKCADGTQQKTLDIVDFCCTQGLVQSTAPQELPAPRAKMDVEAGVVTAKWCSKGDYAVALKSNIVCTREPLVEPACRVCSICGGFWNLDVGIANREHDYGPWRGHGNRCEGGYVELDNSVAPHFCCAETSAASLELNLQKNGDEPSSKHLVLDQDQDDTPPKSAGTVVCPGYSAVIGVHANGTLECAYLTPQCRFCKSCGGFWGHEVGRQLKKNDYGAYSTYGHTCQAPYQANDFTHSDEAVFCCH